MAIDLENESAGIPEWVVTFGDMMSLLLTFFIMLLSLSEVKQEEDYQAMMESLKKQFGHDMSAKSIVPGQTRPRNSAMAKMATMGRARRFDLHKGGDKVKAPVGDNARVVMVRPGSRTTIGAVITFSERSVELTETHKNELKSLAHLMKGKNQKIEVRGHTSLRPVEKSSDYDDNWDLAYQRCRIVMKFLMKMKIDPKRIQMTTAGANEPVHIGTDRIQLKRNPRVEVYMLNSTVGDFHGTEEEKKQRFREEESTEKSAKKSEP